MEFLQTPIAGCLVADLAVIEDSRGVFAETYRTSALEQALGRAYRFAQGNYSRSRAGVLRGFHREAWDKLVYVPHGHALVVVADVRPGSATFGRHVRFDLGDIPGGRRRVFIAEGLANAFFCITEVDYHNDVSGEYDPSRRGGIAWNDPTLAVDWPTDTPILSDADRRLPPLSP